jgi:transmembrane sensor
MRLFRQKNDPSLSEGVRVQAAAWIARLRGEDREEEMDAELQKWLGASEEHRLAFNRMMSAWEQAGKIRMRAQGDVRAHGGGTQILRRRPLSLWRAAAAAVLILAVAAAIHWRNAALVTAIGQQQDLTLRDGTRVVLNTDTRIEVDYDAHARRVRLIRGEARFDVSKHPEWPFLVTVAGREIRALGTSFIVRRDNEEDFAVTLVEGRISIAAVGEKDGPARQAPQILVPGQRFVVSRDRAPSVDRPELGRVTAWQRGRVEFDETPLETAAAEMNRYNATRVTVSGADIARLRIGGEFRAGDSEEFVKIVTVALGLQARRSGNDIVLSRPEGNAAPDR